MVTSVTDTGIYPTRLMSPQPGLCHHWRWFHAEVISWSHFNQRLESLLEFFHFFFYYYYNNMGWGWIKSIGNFFQVIEKHKEKERRGYKKNRNRNNM
jgi:hypothetical protein